jgi:predicted glutamine amidotransferase
MDLKKHLRPLEFRATLFLYSYDFRSIMCELLGMSAALPTGLNESIALLQPRGGRSGPHADGWGLAVYDDAAARIFKEALPAAESQCLTFISSYNLMSKIVLAHIRKANPVAHGRTSANTHPFEREFGGRSWVFAHNGRLQSEALETLPLSGRYLPVGETDSERAFCFLLDRIAEAGLASEAEVIETLRSSLGILAGLGELNLLLSDGRSLYAFANKRLHILSRQCEEYGCRQSVALMATNPLTDEPWESLEIGRLYVFRDGKLLDGVRV